MGSIKPTLSDMFSGVKTVMVKHSPEILTGIGIAGMVTTTVMAVRVTPKALILIEKEKNAMNDSDEDQPVEKLSAKDTVRVTWKLYLPAVVTGTLSVACLIGASNINMKRNATLATAYALSESARKEYSKKVIETIGEKKDRSIRDEIAKEKIQKDPVQSKEVIITAKGDALCYDAASGRYFKSDIEKIRKAENELNRRMRNEMFVSLNDFYDEIDLPRVNIGDDLGWNIDKGYIELSFSSQLATDGTPCLVVDYRIAPRYDYRHLL